VGRYNISSISIIKFNVVQLAAIFLSWQRKKKNERWHLFAPYSVAVNLCDATMMLWNATARYKKLSWHFYSL
jgi:hypothetical protein